MSAERDDGWLRGGWIQTFTGEQFYPLSPQADRIHLADVAHSLSMQCRYNGHVDLFYSVAEHCVHVSRALEAAGEPTEVVLWGLLHDAAEAYVGDMVRPLKRDLPEFSAIEDRILQVMAEKWGLADGDGDSPIPQAVHDADARILLTERAALLSATRHEWDPYVESLEPLEVKIVGWNPFIAEAHYRDRFAELRRRLL